MARPKKEITTTPPENLVGKGENLTGYDLFLVTVNRTTDKKGNGKTESVAIGKRLRKNVKIGEDTADLQNNLQDFRNKTGDGQHTIQWLFPTGIVKTGMEYKAKEAFTTDEDGDDTANKILVIDTNNCLTEI